MKFLGFVSTIVLSLSGAMALDIDPCWCYNKTADETLAMQPVFNISRFSIEYTKATNQTS